MSKPTKQNWFQRFFGSRLFLIVAYIVLGFVVLSFFRSYRQDYAIQQEIEQLKSEIAAQETKKLESLDILTYVQSDAFVEEKARTELNMKKPGETVYVVDRREGLGLGVAHQENGNRAGQHVSNPLKWWYYFIYHALPDLPSQEQ